MITGPNQGFTCVHPSALSLARFLLLARRFLGLHSVLHTLPLPAAHARVRNRLWTLAWVLRPLNQSDLVSPFGIQIKYSVRDRQAAPKTSHEGVTDGLQRSTCRAHPSRTGPAQGHRGEEDVRLGRLPAPRQ